MSTRRFGITIVEVLVVILIMGLLAAILLPAIQAARESGRRVQCASNLRQVALAVQTYEQAQRKLPALYTGPKDTELGGIAAFYLHSWHALILPQLEEAPLYQRLDFSKMASHVDNGPAIATRLPVYICPSATRSQELLDGIRSDVPAWPLQGPIPPPLDTVSAAVTDYQATVGVVWGPPPSEQAERMVHFGAWGEPLADFNYDRVRSCKATRDLRFSHVRDGLSHTMLICEAAGRPDRIRTGEHWYPYNPTAEDDSFAGPEASTWAMSAYYYWLLIYQYEGHSGVNVANFSETFYSFHPQGSHVAMCDGSVQFLAEDTHFRVLQAMVSRDRGD